MAVIVGARQNNGAVVEVIRPHDGPFKDGGFMWDVKPPRPMFNLAGELTNTGWIADKFLSPIRPPEQQLTDTHKDELTA